MKLSRVILPWKPCDVWFIGDIQWNGDRQAVALDHLKVTIEKALAMETQGRTVRFIGCGDYTDFASPSNRARLASANLYDNAVTSIEQRAMDLVQEIYDLALAPTRGKWLGLVEGHHFYQFQSGETSDMKLCELLRAPFVGTSGLVNVVFHRNTSQIGCTIWFHHGVGNGQTGYYPLTRLEKVSAEWEQVDVFAIGHTTKMVTEAQNKVYPRWQNRIEADLGHRKVILLGTGGYSKCYVEGATQGRVLRGSYAERGMMRASIIGSPVLHITPRRYRENDSDCVGLDITAEA